MSFLRFRDHSSLFLFSFCFSFSYSLLGLYLSALSGLQLCPKAAARLPTTAKKERPYLPFTGLSSLVTSEVEKWFHDSFTCFQSTVWNGASSHFWGVSLFLLQTIQIY